MKFITDLQVDVYFLKPDEGGRQRNIAGSIYSCAIHCDNKYFDCRIVLDTPIILGCKYQLFAALLDPQNAFLYLHVGNSISLWEGEDIARGTILQAIKPIAANDN